MAEYINILDLCETGTRELGPGNRYVIWVQGCPFNCIGCITPDGIPIIENNLVEISQIIFAICSNKKITGITISGGEPFMQASKLTKILTAVKATRPELDVVVFTGFRLKELDWVEAKMFLELIDVLIDGKYIEKLNDNKGLRGSSNQQINYLTEKLKDHKSYFEERQRSIEIHVYNQYRTIIGVPNKALAV
ncbi:MAG: anaerobic ribonucleoside-triphosphate reductase activating protein [Segetibacter sp.]|nr:anaerobic ribonucleoside-triphosphate reductase activating protein [Segetibacter sp.]